MVEISLILLFILFLSMLFLLLSLFLYLMVKKHLNNQFQQKVDEYKDAYRIKVFRYLQTGDPDELGNVKEDEELLKALVELLSDYSQLLTGPEIQMRISYFANQHLMNYLEKQLVQRRWSLRMNALYMIEDFYLVNLSEILHRTYNQKKTTVSEKAQILKTLAKFDDKRVGEYIKYVDQNISDFTLLSIFLILEEEKLDKLVEEFQQLSTRLQCLLIETIEKRQLIKHHQFLLMLIENEDEEVKIRALKAIANTGIPIEPELIKDFLQSSSWTTRMMATKVVGMQRLETCKPQLITLLSDREYSVRAEAAKAILRFKDGLAILTNVTKESTDLFAKDMAIEWLEKASGGYSY